MTAKFDLDRRAARIRDAIAAFAASLAGPAPVMRRVPVLARAQVRRPCPAAHPYRGHP